MEHQPSSSFPKVLLIPLAMLLAIAALLLLAFSATQQKEPDFYTFKVVNIRGKLVSLEKYRGSVSPRGTGGARPGSLPGRSVHVCGARAGRRGGCTLTRWPHADGFGVPTPLALVWSLACMLPAIALLRGAPRSSIKRLQSAWETLCASPLLLRAAACRRGRQGMLPLPCLLPACSLPAFHSAGRAAPGCGCSI